MADRLTIDEPGANHVYQSKQDLLNAALPNGSLLVSVEDPERVFMLVWVGYEIRNDESTGAQLLCLDTGWIEEFNHRFPVRMMRAGTKVTVAQIYD